MDIYEVPLELIRLFALLYGLCFQSTLWLLVVIFLWSAFDLSHYTREAYEYISTLFKDRSLRILDAFSYRGIVLPADLDLFCHMNNSRYARETDFARVRYFMRTGVGRELIRQNYRAMLTAQTFRFRRSINPFECYRIETKVVYWDDTSLYFEHKFLDSKNFLRTTQYAKVLLLPRGKVSPSHILSTTAGELLNTPICPEDLKAWIEYDRHSREAMRK